uniref:Insertion element IS150 protein InsJ-like helix-turn-helix domain-containing protein n=1 Tax=Oryzias sinensis TaxID=183150 RepID=A0A8C7X7U5_9TELE
MPQMSQVLRERGIGMLIAGMSTRAVARELNVYFSTIRRLQRRFREFGSTSNRPHNRRVRVTTPAQDLHIQHVHLQDRLRPATRTAAETIGLHNHRISAQTVRNRLREAHLHVRRPHRGLDLTPVRRRNRLECSHAMVSGTLERCSLHGLIPVYTVQGRWQTACVCHVGERFSDVNVVDRVAHGGGGVMVWAGICYGRRTHFIDGILNAQRYRDEILGPIVVPYIQQHHLVLQDEKARPHVARICTQFLEAETSQFLHGQHTHQTCHPLSMFGMLWIGVYDSVFQFLPISTTSHSH